MVRLTFLLGIFLPCAVAFKDEGLEDDASLFNAYLAETNPKPYPYNADDYATRRQIFADNLHRIHQHNENNGASYKLGIHQYSDLLPNEVPKGYVKPYHRHHHALSNTAATGRRREMLSRGSGATTIDSLESILTTEPVADLPKSVDWRKKGITTPVKNQYFCGSCWAFASTAVIESHVARATGTLFSLSEQELVSCANNTYHCGGTGGCAGSTAEIAMEFVRSHGMVDEWAFGYDSNHGAAVPCSLKETRRSVLRRDDNAPQYYKGSVATIDGWVTLPPNNYTAVMNAVAKLGPLAVSVACHPWLHYKQGIYSGSLNSTSDTDVNHLVVLEGYGTDGETGLDFWLVRNSWGPKWGEAGYIRLARVDPASLDNPDDDCGFDTTPADGVECTIDEDGNPIDPPNEKICGNSGILYDVTVPLGAHLI